MVIDLEGGMIARYYRPGYDIIINPFDERTHCWDFQKEVLEKDELYERMRAPSERVDAVPLWTDERASLLRILR